MQARRVLVIRSPSACNSMSSQTHPQNVQVAFFTTVSSMSPPRQRGSRPPGPGGTTNVHPSLRPRQPPRHVPPGLDLFPGRDRFAVGGRGKDYLPALLGVVAVVWLVHPVILPRRVAPPARSRPPTPWRWASRSRRWCCPSADRSAGRR